MAYALHHFKLLLTSCSFNKGFFAAIRPINPNYRLIRFTVLTEEVWLYLYSINNSRAVFFGFPFEARMSNHSDLCVLSGLRPLLGKFFNVSCCWNFSTKRSIACLEIFRSIATFLWDQPSFNFWTTNFLISMDNLVIFHKYIYIYIYS